MKKIKGLIILFFLFAPTVVFANGEDETPQNEELSADSLEKLHIDLEAANKKIKERTNREKKYKYQFPNDHRYKIKFKNYFFSKKYHSNK